MTALTRFQTLCSHQVVSFNVSIKYHDGWLVCVPPLCGPAERQLEQLWCLNHFNCPFCAKLLHHFVTFFQWNTPWGYSHGADLNVCLYLVGNEASFGLLWNTSSRNQLSRFTFILLFLFFFDYVFTLGETFIVMRSLLTSRGNLHLCFRS